MLDVDKLKEMPMVERVMALNEYHIWLADEREAFRKKVYREYKKEWRRKKRLEKWQENQ